MRIKNKLYYALNKISDGFRFIESRRVQCGSEHAFMLPMGKCSSDVEKRLDTLVAAVGAPVELIDRGGAIVVRVVERDFPLRMPFKEDDLKMNQLLIGYNRLFQPIYHRPMHLLSGGAAGSGKTVWIKFILYQLVKMGAVVKVADLKGFSFFPFESLPKVHVAKNLEDTAELLSEACAELERREQIVIRTRSREAIKDFPYYVVVIDEAAQIAPKMHSGRMKDYARFCDESVARIAQKGREPKVILLYCTQRPDASIINGQVKSNVEAAVAFRTYSNYDSRIILNAEGAERISVATPGRCLFRGEQFHTLQVPFIGESDREWDKLLFPLKVEVMQHGSSHRAEVQRIYLEGSYTSANSRNEATGFPQQFAGPAKESVKNTPGVGRREVGSMEVPRTRKDMVSFKERPKTSASYTNEVPE